MKGDEREKEGTRPKRTKEQGPRGQRNKAQENKGTRPKRTKEQGPRGQREHVLLRASATPPGVQVCQKQQKLCHGMQKYKAQESNVRGLTFFRALSLPPSGFRGKWIN